MAFNADLKLGLFVIIISAFTIYVNGLKILNEKPDFLKPCSLKDPQIEVCFNKNFKNIFGEWKAGNPIFKPIGSLDPLHIKRISMQHAKSPLEINFDLLEIEMKGLGGFLVKESKHDFEALNGIMTFEVPKILVESNYKMKGKILSLDLNATGKTTISIDKFVSKMFVHFKLRDSDGFTFADVEKLKVEVLDIGGFHIHMGNLFNGQKDLEDGANSLFNDNWRDFFEIMRPAISSSIEAVMNDRLKKLFAIIPVHYVIEDFPSAATYYG
ncbi:uncharacterized protein LOC131994756 [Stomoxys calcitrans]|uniref:uncharacterized protein LOC131994756 n=1 Tax=Stomoxys calcitrans TaxID=35570 RepID=UPI0027E22C20|nr:uncharacterized protein LOC131994756 [Stomoxys calcitrans]